MSKPELATETQVARVGKLLPEFFSDRRVKSWDRQKLQKIQMFLVKEKTVTAKQYKAFVHFCKVYDKKLDNSIEFILDD